MCSNLVGSVSYVVCKLRLNSEKYVKGHVQLWWWSGNVSDSFCYFRTHERHAVGRAGVSLFYSVAGG